MAATFEAFFLPVSGSPQGRACFCVHHLPTDRPVRGLVVYVHPFAEEMNKARRMAALQSRALAAQGMAVLQIDLTGCGDSSGAFDGATWLAWVDDVVAACAWLVERHAHNANSSPPALWLWGLRAGCLIATAARRRLPTPWHLLFWQPVVSGRQHLQQFLRLKMAGNLAAGTGRGTTDTLRRQLERGEPVDVAGYRLSADLASGLDAARLLPPTSPPARVIWIELSSREEAQLLPASATAIAEWQAAGHAASAQVVRGPAFWQTVEIEHAPDLIDATQAALLHEHGAASAEVKSGAALPCA
jgi:uncharacterized protein